MRGEPHPPLPDLAWVDVAGSAAGETDVSVDLHMCRQSVAPRDEARSPPRVGAGALSPPVSASGVVEGTLQSERGRKEEDLKEVGGAWTRRSETAMEAPIDASVEHAENAGMLKLETR